MFIPLHHFPPKLLVYFLLICGRFFLRAKFTPENQGFGGRIQTGRGRKGSTMEYVNSNYGLKICPKTFQQGMVTRKCFSKKCSDLSQEASCFSAPDLGLVPCQVCRDFDLAGFGWKHYASTKLLVS